jgi:16S rRNA (guanine(966)-N(2))-methyltransferase RsmD
VTRIVAGRYGGRRIEAPPGRDTRPTSDRVREALFGALGVLDGLRFLDLYAGSGAIGLEAASRGAAQVMLVESEPAATRIVRRNIAALAAGPVVSLAPARVASVLAAGPTGGEPFDVVFADPPYAADEAEITGVLAGLAGQGWLAPEALVIVERSSRSPEPAWVPGVTGERSRRYGETTLWYGRAT